MYKKIIADILSTKKQQLLTEIESKTITWGLRDIKFFLYQIDGEDLIACKFLPGQCEDGRFRLLKKYLENLLPLQGANFQQVEGIYASIFRRYVPGMAEGILFNPEDILILRDIASSTIYNSQSGLNFNKFLDKLHFIGTAQEVIYKGNSYMYEKLELQNSLRNWR